MKFRSQPFPRTFNDWATTLFLLVTVPITYWFELWLIIPETISTDSTFYWLNSIFGAFIVFGIYSNMFAVMLCNTSIVGRKIVRPSKANAALWKYCAACESLSPPRAWHCTTCRVCILKRDHHCMFTGCCIGHHNQRYFIYLLLFICIGSTYSSLFNSYYFWVVRGDELRNGISLLKIIFPLAMLMYDTTATQCYLVMYLLNVVGGAFSGFLLYHHCRNIWRGCLTHESIRQFDLGPMENIRQVLGERWYLTWVSPFVQSRLPFDGIDWQQIYDKTVKNM